MSANSGSRDALMYALGISTPAACEGNKPMITAEKPPPSEYYIIYSAGTIIYILTKLFLIAVRLAIRQLEFHRFISRSSTDAICARRDKCLTFTLDTQLYPLSNL